MANEELLQKLRRRRLLMGEDMPTVGQSSHAPREKKELQGDLDLKLRRQNMGEMDRKTAQPRTIDTHDVKVKQRALKFQSDSRQPSCGQPGRVHLRGWEERRHMPEAESTEQGAALPKTDLGEDGAEGSLTINEVPKREVRLDMPDTGALRSEPEQPGAQGLSAPPDQMESSATDGCLGSLSSGTPCPEDQTSETAKPAAEAECFFMWDSDDDTCSTYDECAPTEKKEAEEPLEFSMLDYLAALPEGVAEKLHNCLKTHEDLVRRLCQRNDLLRAHIRNLRRDATEAKASPKCQKPISRSPQSSQAVAEARRKRQLKAEMTAKVEAMSSERLRLRDEQHEANLRARLQRTIRASRERVQTMQRRVHREEQQVKSRFEAALQNREGMERSIKAALKEQSMARHRIAELEESINSEATRCRTKEKERDQLLEKQNSLRNEIKAHRSRAMKHQQRERRIQDMQREVEALAKVYHSESPRWTL
ncbi:unnamed protein product [Effrenium voratum]|nr:unnamed protein product [Effrenium voratum]|mmetsp:Transcript_20165/g.47698  ORF Transcript_20165/g.47698 Transcript_20165/m.47698 type:complete len:479 (+) Transcript_20165:77-1513(+)